MNKRRTAKWARYFNRYAMIPMVRLGGDSAVAAICGKHRQTFQRIRRQG